MPTTFNNIFIVKKETLFVVVLFGGMLLAYFSSLYPWPLWPIKSHAATLAGMILMSAFVFKPRSQKILTRTDFILPAVVYTVLEIYQRLVGDSNIVGFISVIFHAMIFLTLFRMDGEVRHRLMMFLTKFMAVIQVFALFGFFLYIMGFPLPSRDVTFDDQFYYYTNYFFFLLDDRSLLVLFPRFQSYFIEPNYHGTACVLLLFYQCGNWKRWYNIVLLVAALLSFSLSAYVLLVVMLFLNSWRQGKRIFKQVVLTVAIIASVVGASFVYNDGDNLVHNLILLRLEVDDGELAGNDRITDNFKHDYEKFWKGDKILFGDERDKSEFGNQGYQVYILENGLVGLVLLIVFYIVALRRATNMRCLLSAALMVTLIFGVNGEITWYQIFIPIYCAAYADPKLLLKNKPALPIESQSAEPSATLS